MNTDHAVHAIPPFYATKFMDRNVLSITVNRTVALFHPNKIAEQIYAEAKPTALEMGVVLLFPLLSLVTAVFPLVSRKKMHNNSTSSISVLFRW